MLAGRKVPKFVWVNFGDLQMRERERELQTFVSWKAFGIDTVSYMYDLSKHVYTI